MLFGSGCIKYLVHTTHMYTVYMCVCVCSLAFAKLLTTVVSFLCAMLLYLVVFGTMFVAVCFLTAVLVHSTVMAGGDRSGRQRPVMVLAVKRICLRWGGFA